MSDQSKTNRTSRVLPRLLIFVAVVTTGLVVASAAFAAWTTINTNSGTADISAWSTSWPTPPYEDPCQTPAPNDNFEIKKAWYGSDGTFVYFRMETCGGTALGATSAGNAYRAIAAIDCNADGDFDDGFTFSNPASGDRLIVYVNDGSDLVQVVSGQFQAVINSPNNQYAEKVSVTTGTTPTPNTIEWKIDLNALYPACRASISSVKLGFTTARVAPTPAATIDYARQTFDWHSPIDFGDHSNPTATPGGGTPAQACASPNYATRLGCNGARHGAVGPTPGNPLRFGSALTDGDGGDLQDVAATGDDTHGTTPDDEGGIAPDPTNPWNDAGGRLLFTIQGAAQARVTCWIDWNKNRQWTDAAELVINNLSFITSSTTGYNITLPDGKTFPNSWPARCRVYPVGVNPTPIPPSGPIEFGEVEDHIWEFDASGNFMGAAEPSAVTNLAIATSGTIDVTLTWTNPAPNDGAHVLGHATIPYFTSATGGFAVDSVVSATPWEYTHAGVRGAPAETVYYIVYGRLGATDATAPSNRVGLFEFGLTAGLP